MYRYLFALFALATLLVSCKKMIDPEPLSQNRVLGYRVVNLADTVLYGVVNEPTQTITVYVPFHYGLSVIEPELLLSPGATLAAPAEPVLLTADTTGKAAYILNDGAPVRYTVKGADGTARVYTLEVLLQGTPPLSIWWMRDWESPLGAPNNTLSPVGGNFYTRNQELCTWQLIHTGTGAVTTLPKQPGSFLLDDSTYSTASIKVPAEIDTGLYRLRVHFLGQQATAPDPVRIRFVQPTPGGYIGTRTAKRGETITYEPYNSVFVNAVSVTVTINGVAIPLPIVSCTRTLITLKIPDDFPVGQFNDVRFRFTFQGWGVPITRGNLVISL